MIMAGYDYELELVGRGITLVNICVLVIGMVAIVLYYSLTTKLSTISGE